MQLLGNRLYKLHGLQIDYLQGLIGQVFQYHHHLL